MSLLRHPQSMKVRSGSVYDPARPARDEGRFPLDHRARYKVWPGHRSEPQIVASLWREHVEQSVSPFDVLRRSEEGDGDGELSIDNTARVLLGVKSEHELDRRLKAGNITKRTKYSATSIPEIEEGLCALVVPILDRSQRIIAAINVIGNVSRSSPSTMISTILPQLKDAAQEINTPLLSNPSSTLADRSSIPVPV